MPTPRLLARLLTATAVLATAIAVVLASPLPQPRQATASPPIIDMAPVGQPPRQLDFSVEDQFGASGVYSVPVNQSTRFDAVLVADGVTVSAIVTVSAVTNSRTTFQPGGVPGVYTLDEMPQNATVSPYLQTSLQRETAFQPTRVTYLIAFIDDAHGTPVLLDNLRLNVYDIDSQEFVEFPNALSYFLASNTHLTPSRTGSGVLRFDAPDASTSTGSPDFTAYTTGRGEVLYPRVSEIELSFGVPTGGRAYEFDFSEGQPWLSNGVDTRRGPLNPANPTVPGTDEEQVVDSVVLPPAVSELVTQPIAPPTTTPSTTVPTTRPPTTTVPATTPTTVPAPVPTGGVLPELEPGASQVITDGVPTNVEVFIDNTTDLVLRGQGFELRLAGDCAFGCTIQTDAQGREVLTLEERGLANVSGEGFQAGTLVYIWLFSEPRFLGTLRVNADGTFTGNVPLGDIAPGLHTLQVNGTSFDGLPRTANLGVIVNPTGGGLPTPGPGALPATGTNTTPLWLIALTLLSIGLVITTTRRRTNTRC